MKIKRKEILESRPGHDDVLNVYDFYVKDRRNHYVVSPALCEGLLVLGDDEIEIIDSRISDEFISYDYDGFRGKAHWILADEKLYEGLLENDPECYEIFMQKLNGQKNPQN